jgi:hypothetical protein
MCCLKGKLKPFSVKIGIGYMTSYPLWNVGFLLNMRLCKGEEKAKQDRSKN